MKNNKEDFLLTLSPKYIPDWDKWAAFRELMQNVIDRNNEMASAEIIFSYNEQKQRITIGNKFSYLDKKTLVLGETTKTDNEDAIGKYGEGYKLAMLVFLRMGTRIRVRTGCEVWAPSIKYSEKFGTDLLTITVMQTTPTDNLLFELDGINSADYAQFKKNCIMLNTVESKIKTTFGNILLDDQFKSKLFVEGLFVCEFTKQQKIRYGYNMKSRYVPLDRDRKRVEAYNLLWEVGRMLNELDSTYANLIYSLQRDEYRDVDYYQTHVHNKDNPLYKAICAMHYNDFVAKYGKKVIPVKSEDEAKFVKEKYNNLEPIVLNAVTYVHVTNSSAYEASSKAKVPLEETPYSLTMKIIKKILAGKELKAKREELLATLLPETRKWRKR